MTREEMKEIICRIVEKLRKTAEAPPPACIFEDNPCDVGPNPSTLYGMGEEN